MNDSHTYVTWRDLYAQLDQINQRLSRVETWLKVGAGLIPLAVAFAPAIAHALT